MRKPSESRWALVLDLVSARALAWIATRGPDTELTPEAHRFFYDRYRRLGAWHRRRGHVSRARQLLAKAELHWEASGGDGPPYAAAMALPRPRCWVRTDAVSRTHLGGPDEAA
jgi:hypothetical protein